MKVLLVYPRYGYHNAGGVQEPLGILYLAGALECAGHEATVWDLSFMDELPPVAEMLDGVGMVGISSSTALYGRTLEVLRAVKSARPELPVALGGPHATALPKNAVEDGFDVAVVGEAELSAPVLASALEQDFDLDEVPGIAYREGDEIRLTPPPVFIDDLDSLPHPDRSRIDYGKYFDAGLGQVGVVAMRGCPYRCTYCKPMQDRLFGRKIRYRSAADVADEVNTIARNIQDRVLFRDDAFTTHSPEWFAELGRHFRRLKTPLWGWACQGRVDQITPERLDAMQKAGLRMIAFGVESGSNRILDYYRKGITPEQTERAFAMCRERSIATHAFIMIGAPIETPEDINATLQLLERIKPNSVSPSITTPAPGTALYEDAVRDGIYNIKDWADADYMANTRPLELPHLSVEQILDAKEKMAAMGTGYGE